MRRACACGPSDGAPSPGEGASGEPGFVHIVDCATGAEGPGMSVEVGWSKDPNAKVELARADRSAGSSRRTDRTACGWSRRAPRPGLEPSAPPSLDIIPNNHRSYAIQWFLFAGIAALIYGLALRARLEEGAGA